MRPEQSRFHSDDDMATEEDPNQLVKRQLNMASTLVCGAIPPKKLTEATAVCNFTGGSSPLQQMNLVTSGTSQVPGSNTSILGQLQSKRQSTLDTYYKSGDKPAHQIALGSKEACEIEKINEDIQLGKREMQIEIKEEIESDASAAKLKKKHLARSKTQGQVPEGGQSSEDSEVGSDQNAKAALGQKSTLSVIIAEGMNSTVTLDRFFSKQFEKEKVEIPNLTTGPALTSASAPNQTGAMSPSSQPGPPNPTAITAGMQVVSQSGSSPQLQPSTEGADPAPISKSSMIESAVPKMQPIPEQVLIQQIAALNEHCRKLEQSLASYTAQRPQLLRLVLELEGYRRRERLEYIAHERIRLGEPGIGGQGASWSEGWEGSRLKVRLCELAQDRTRLEGIRKRVRKGIKKHASELDQNSQTTTSTPGNSMQSNQPYLAGLALSPGILNPVPYPNIPHMPLLSQTYPFQNANLSASSTTPLLSLLGSDGLPASELELQSLEPGLSLKDLNEISRRLENKISTLSKEEQVLKEKLEQLDREKVPYLQESRLLSEEMSSTFGKPDSEDGRTHYPLFKDRYQLVGLLGKGGFSEVYKAFDLEELSYKAFKLHRLNPDWPDTTKQSFLKYATRECEVHRKLVHPNILRLHDVVPVGEHSFATVLEYCEGPDLARYIRRNKVIAEREAKIIIRQVLEALQYLSDLKDGKVIHYDLKPGNIIFHKGIIKVADFGLCKQLAADQNKTELTSVGVGTYWYLPPETFQVGSRLLSISPKVDIWSLGVVFFEMLYGAKPFGNGISQQEILKSNLMLRATHVEFPNKPNVTTETKDFIRKCLSYNPDDRYDINQAVQALSSTK